MTLVSPFALFAGELAGVRPGLTVIPGSNRASHEPFGRFGARTALSAYCAHRAQVFAALTLT